MKYNPTENPIIIKCKAHQLEPIDRLLEFQGNLKRLSEKNREKLIGSICTKGFIAPLFVWDDAGDWKLLDGHQRLKTLIWMREHGWDIPLLPVDIIEAEDEQDAKRKLLAITSQYGEFDIDGYMEFTDGIEIDDTIRLSDGEFKIITDAESESEYPKLKDGDKEPFQTMTFTLADEQAEIVKEAVKKAQEEGCESEANQNRNGNALAMICEVFLGH
jgi:hypothetical protein